MEFKLTMKMDNAVFGEQPEGEVARLLRELADYVSTRPLTPGDEYPLMDFNGNKVGKAEVIR